MTWHLFCFCFALWHLYYIVLPSDAVASSLPVLIIADSILPQANDIIVLPRTLVRSSTRLSRGGPDCQISIIPDCSTHEAQRPGPFVYLTGHSAKMGQGRERSRLLCSTLADISVLSFVMAHLPCAKMVILRTLLDPANHWFSRAPLNIQIKYDGATTTTALMYRPPIQGWTVQAEQSWLGLLTVLIAP